MDYVLVEESVCTERSPTERGHIVPERGQFSYHRTGYITDVASMRLPFKFLENFPPPTSDVTELIYF